MSNIFNEFELLDFINLDNEMWETSTQSESVVGKDYFKDTYSDYWLDTTSDEWYEPDGVIYENTADTIFMDTSSVVYEDLIFNGKEEHRYWRIWIPAHASNAGIQNWAEFGFYDATPNSTDDDLCSGGTPIGSGLSGGSFGDLFDNNSTTWAYWTTGNGWVGYDFGAGNEKEVTYVHLQQRQYTYGQYAGYFEVQYSDDGETWITSWAVTAVTPWDGWELRCYKNDGTIYTKAVVTTDPQKQWRVRATATQDGNGYMSPCEILFLDAFQNQISYTGGVASSSSEIEGSASEIFDGVVSGSDNYCACSLSSGGWAAFSFASNVSVRGFTFYARDTSYYCNQSPVSFVVECKTDDLSLWTEVWSDTTTADWTQNEARTFIYTILSCALSLDSGSYPESSTIEITANVAGATIYYTTDGSDPTISSNVYSGPIPMFDGMLKAFAVASGYDDSGIVSAEYTISSSTVAQPIIFIVL